MSGPTPSGHGRRKGLEMSKEELDLAASRWVVDAAWDEAEAMQTELGWAVLSEALKRSSRCAEGVIAAMEK